MLLWLCRFNCLLLVLVFSQHSYAIEQPLAEQLLQRSIVVPKVQYQITAVELSAEELVRDRALFHQFNDLPAGKATLRVTAQQALWLLVQLNNPFPETWQAWLHYPFLPADRLSFYQLQPEIPSAQLLGKTGSLLPYSERALPVRGYVQSISLEANGSATLLLKIQDASLLGTELRLASLPILLAEAQQQLLEDALLSGVLLLLVLTTLYCSWLQRNTALCFLAGFYLSFALVLGILNGLAFNQLWPFYPELNPVILYIAVGSCLLCLTLFSRRSLLQYAGPRARQLNMLAAAAALLLIFSPLFASGPLKLQLLFVSVSIALSIIIIQAIYISLTTELKAAPRYALLATLGTFCLLFVQTRYLSGFAEWLNLAIFLLLVSSALLLLPARSQRLN
ncbi:MAG: 7TM diverse intracellular signaling domain-containing protein [Alishewanella aestuarii]